MRQREMTQFMDDVIVQMQAMTFGAADAILGGVFE